MFWYEPGQNSDENEEIFSGLLRAICGLLRAIPGYLRAIFGL